MNEIWAGPGRKCPYCNCWFQCSDDMNSHLKAFGRFPHSVKKPNGAINSILPKDLDMMQWRKGEQQQYCSVKMNPFLARALLLHGRMRIGLFNYSLNKNQKWIQRKRIRI